MNSRGRRSKYNNELVGKQSRINYTSYFGRFILHYFNYQYVGDCGELTLPLREARWESGSAFLPCAIFTYEPRVKMHYETKIYSTRFNADTENSIICGKVFFKIIEKEVMVFCKFL